MSDEINIGGLFRGVDSAAGGSCERICLISSSSFRIWVTRSGSRRMAAFSRRVWRWGRAGIPLTIFARGDVAGDGGAGGDHGSVADMHVVPQGGLAAENDARSQRLRFPPDRPGRRSRNAGRW